MSAPFRTKVPGKWVLAGEHAVLKGARAIALPHPEFGLSLEFAPGAGELQVLPIEARPIVLDILGAAGVAPPFGKLEIQSTIPNGAGLGSSAAFCVALTRWLAPRLGLAPGELREFATRLEDRFHGKSSGMDVAVASEARPIVFRMGQAPEPLELARLPRFTFHDSGLRARTQACVAQVEAIRRSDPARGERLDSRMGQASARILEGLLAFSASSDSAAGLSEVAEGMRLGDECFRQWDLVPGPMRALQEGLRAQGALATKVTGAGGGGWVVALWSR